MIVAIVFAAFLRTDTCKCLDPRTRPAKQRLAWLQHPADFHQVKKLVNAIKTNQVLYDKVLSLGWIIEKDSGYECDMVGP